VRRVLLAELLPHCQRLHLEGKQVLVVIGSSLHAVLQQRNALFLPPHLFLHFVHVLAIPSLFKVSTLQLHL
jgi:hypothetical protein